MKHISDEDLASVLDKARREADGGKQPCTWGLVASALEELREHRATLASLRAWAEELRSTRSVGPFIAEELENRIAGRKLT